MSKKEQFEEMSEAELVDAQGGCPFRPCMPGGCASQVVVAPQPVGYGLSTQIPGAPVAAQQVVVSSGGCRGGWGGGWGAFFRW